MSNETGGNRTVVHSRDRHGCVLKTTWEPVAVRERNGNARLVRSAIDESVRRDGFSVRELENNVDEKMTRRKRIAHNMSRETKTWGTSRLESPHAAIKTDVRRSPTSGCLSPLGRRELRDLAATPG